MYTGRLVYINNSYTISFLGAFLTGTVAVSNLAGIHQSPGSYIIEMTAFPMHEMHILFPYIGIVSPNRVYISLSVLWRVYLYGYYRPQTKFRTR